MSFKYSKISYPVCMMKMASGDTSLQIVVAAAQKKNRLASLLPVVLALNCSNSRRALCLGTFCGTELPASTGEDYWEVPELQLGTNHCWIIN